jgi:hypothetical protein
VSTTPEDVDAILADPLDGKCLQPVGRDGYGECDVRGPHQIHSKYPSGYEKHRDGTAGQPVHRYLSTGCWHGGDGHAYCQSNTGSNGQKTPAQCKFCAAPCRCDCHRGAGRG